MRRRCKIDIVFQRILIQVESATVDLVQIAWGNVL